MRLGKIALILACAPFMTAMVIGTGFEVTHNEGPMCQITASLLFIMAIGSGIVMFTAALARTKNSDIRFGLIAGVLVPIVGIAVSVWQPTLIADSFWHVSIGLAAIALLLLAIITNWPRSRAAA